MVPGARPFAELEAAAAAVVARRARQPVPTTRRPHAGVLRAALRVLPDDSARLLLVIDQFEELFTLVSNEDERSRFLAGLVDAIDGSRDQVKIVLTLRADFYGRPLAYPEFGSRLGDGIVNVVPLTSDELEMAAMRPAEGVGVTLEPALVAALLTDVAGRPGTLPLFQYALTELFDRRVDHTLGLTEYRAMGGLSGALTRRAEDLFARLDDEQRSAARQLLLRLVNIAENDEWTRRRVPASEILSLDADLLALQTVIDVFSMHRLIVLDRDAVTGSPTAEVAHESLLSNWPRCRGWIEDARDDIKRHVLLSVAINEWQEADENPDYLLSGARLRGVHRLGNDDDHAPDVRGASVPRRVERAPARLAVDRERSRIGAKAARSARRRLWAIAAVVVAVLVGAGLVASGVFDEPPGPTVAFFGYRGDGAWNENIAAGIDRAAQQHHMVLVDAPAIIDRSTDFRALAERGPDIIISDAEPLLRGKGRLHGLPRHRVRHRRRLHRPPQCDRCRVRQRRGCLSGRCRGGDDDPDRRDRVRGRRLPRGGRLPGRLRGGRPLGRSRRRGAGDTSSSSSSRRTVVSRSSPGIDPISAPTGRPRSTSVAPTSSSTPPVGPAGASSLPSIESSTVDFVKLWTIGVDNDQWFQVDEIERSHVLTSLIKRGDVAAELLVELLIRDEPAGGAVHVGLAADVFRLSTQGGWLSDDTIATVERAETAIAEGRLVVPEEPTGEVLELDPIQNAFEGAMSVLTREQVDEYLHTWLGDHHPVDLAASCSFSTVRWSGDAACLEVITTHLPEYIAESPTL